MGLRNAAMSLLAHVGILGSRCGPFWPAPYPQGRRDRLSPGCPLKLPGERTAAAPLLMARLLVLQFACARLQPFSLSRLHSIQLFKREGPLGADWRLICGGHARLQCSNTSRNSMKFLGRIESRGTRASHWRWRECLVDKISEGVVTRRASLTQGYLL